MLSPQKWFLYPGLLGREEKHLVAPDKQQKKHIQQQYMKNKTTWYGTSYDSNPHSDRRENLKTHDTKEAGKQLLTLCK